MKVKLKVTDLDVFVDGRRVGYVTDCGDCWRGSLLGRRKRRLFNRDFNSRAAAVRAVVELAAPSESVTTERKP